MTEDITYCISDCPYMRCKRNKKNIYKSIPHSYAELKNTEYCLLKGGDDTCNEQS